MSRLILFLFVGSVCLSPAAPGIAAEKPINYLDPPQGQFVNDWMIVEMSGSKAGYAHTTMTRNGDEISTSSLTFFKLERAELAISVSIKQSTRETVAGVPLSFVSIQKLGQTEMKTRGTIKDGEAKVTSTQFGFDTKRTAKLPESAKMSWGVFRESIERGFKAGTTYEQDFYEPTVRVDGTVKSRTTIGERVKINHLGQEIDAIRVVNTIEMGAGQVDSVVFIDDQGQVIQAETSMGGIALKFMRVDRETALKDFDAPEFFMNTLVEVERAIDRATAKRIVYELRATGENQELPDLPETLMQTIRDKSPRSAVVDVRRVDRAAFQSATQAAPTPEMEEYLRSTAALNSKDDLIISMSKKAAGDSESPYAVADRLRVHVSDIIVEKNLSVGFATASEVCRRREGDCTEHAVLLAALGRARGIPSRVAVGLAYVPSFAGKRNVFGFHMWTQFHIGGKWVDFDAALRETDCSPGRIVLATSSLKDSAIGDLALPILEIMTGLEITIKSIETR